MWAKLIGVSAVVGVVVGVIATRLLSGTTGLVLAVAVSMFLAAHLVQAWLIPQLYKDQLRKLRDGGGESPPPGSEPVTAPLVTAWARAVNEGDLATAADMLAEDFRCECPQLDRTFGRARYLRALRTQQRQFPLLDYAVQEVREAAGELWIRTTMTLKARRREPLVTESWEAWRVDGERILGMRQGRVLEVSGAGTA